MRSYISYISHTDHRDGLLYGASPLELRVLLKWWPWPPFSQARIISDESIWVLSSLQFHFQFTIRSWKQSSAAIKLPKNQLQFKQAVERMWIKLRGPVDQSPYKIHVMKICQKIFLYISNVKFTMKGCPENFCVVLVFSVHDMKQSWCEFHQ